MIACDLLQKLHNGDKYAENIGFFEVCKNDLGYGLLLKADTPKVSDITNEQIRQAGFITGITFLLVIEMSRTGH